MPTSPHAQRTDLSVDIAGRYTRNGLGEAGASVALEGRPFELVAIGGGRFGARQASSAFRRTPAALVSDIQLQAL